MVASIISIVALGSALTCCSGCDGKRYFQERKKLAVLACTGLVQQTVQIVASHDLTLLFIEFLASFLDWPLGWP